ncbi:hypothetical protein RLJ94_00675 [Streptococcus pneumoniae]|nr:hypothetical protein [Streptococcus pneumoniae]
MNKRQRKKKILNGLNKEERYHRTHCPVCDSEAGLFDRYLIRTVSALNIVVMNTMEFQDYKIKD